MTSQQDELLTQKSATAVKRRRGEPEGRHRLTSEAAYQRAERRGFEGGNPVVDWLEAEHEIEERQVGQAR